MKAFTFVIFFLISWTTTCFGAPESESVTTVGRSAQSSKLPPLPTPWLNQWLLSGSLATSLSDAIVKVQLTTSFLEKGDALAKAYETARMLAKSLEEALGQSQLNEAAQGSESPEGMNSNEA